MDTIPWGLLKDQQIDGWKYRMFQWILFLGAYLKSVIKGNSGEVYGFSGYYSLGLT